MVPFCKTGKTKLQAFDAVNRSKYLYPKDLENVGTKKVVAMIAGQFRKRLTCLSTTMILTLRPPWEKLE